MSLPNYRRRKPGSSTSNLQSKAHEFENVAQSASQGRASEKPEQVPKKKQKKTEECSLPGNSSSQNSVLIDSSSFYIKELKDAELCSKEQAKKYLRDFDLVYDYGPCMSKKSHKLMIVTS